MKKQYNKKTIFLTDEIFYFYKTIPITNFIIFKKKQKKE